MRHIDAARREAWQRTDLSSSEKLVVLAFLYADQWGGFVDYDTLGGAHPGNKRLGECAGLHPDTVKAILGRLERRGVLVKDHQGGSRRGAERQASIWRYVPDRGSHAPSTGGLTPPRTSPSGSVSDAPELQEEQSSPPGSPGRDRELVPNTVRSDDPEGYDARQASYFAQERERIRLELSQR